MKKQVVLIVLDGWGYREDKKDNAVATAKHPNFDKYWNKFPHTLLGASGHYVGLPDGQMGNSEVGHTTIGAGSIIDTDLVRIGKAIAEGQFSTNPTFVDLFNHVKKYNSTLHVQGLIGTGGVHAHSDHLIAFMKAAKEAGIKKVAIHVFTDGRDTSPKSAGKYIKELGDELHQLGLGFIASVTGRYYAMDRDNNMDRIKKAEEAIFECKGNVCTIKPSDYVNNLYKEGKLDEYFEPIVCMADNGHGCAVEKNDGIFFFNFRADRARQLTQEILAKKDMNIKFVTLTEYCDDYTCKVAFPPIVPGTTLAKEISNADLSQAHIAETEKFAHATYFLNGGVEKEYSGEKHILVPSRKDVKTHDQAPEMRAIEIAEKAVEEIDKGTDFIFINFANADMVGHTANVPAIIKAIETADKALGMVVDHLLAKGGVAFITADHGNAEINVDQNTGEKHTAHTTNPVPAIFTLKEKSLSSGGGLADIAPTVLCLLDINKPKEMTGRCLLD